MTLIRSDKCEQGATAAVRLVGAVALMVMLAMAGCESAPKGSSGKSPSDRLTAGMNAHRAGKDSEAIAILTPLTTEKDKAIAGRAAASVGLIYEERGDHTRAAEMFRIAADNLTGNDAAQAAYHLGRCYQRMGRWPEARTSLAQAQSKATDPALREAARSVQTATGYTIQFGAFSTRTNADQQAVALRRESEAAGLGVPRVVPSKSANGQQLYLVQAGKFNTFEAAVGGKTKLSRANAIIVTAQ
jgi:tetratricopeptide (TPR) repeat protein